MPESPVKSGVLRINWSHSRTKVTSSGSRFLGPIIGTTGQRLQPNRRNPPDIFREYDRGRYGGAGRAAATEYSAGRMQLARLCCTKFIAYAEQAALAAKKIDPG